MEDKYEHTLDEWNWIISNMHNNNTLLIILKVHGLVYNFRVILSGKQYNIMVINKLSETAP